MILRIAQGFELRLLGFLAPIANHESPITPFTKGLYA
jgi:hypothetical protein